MLRILLSLPLSLLIYFCIYMHVCISLLSVSCLIRIGCKLRYFHTYLKYLKKISYKLHSKSSWNYFVCTCGARPIGINAPFKAVPLMVWRIAIFIAFSSPSPPFHESVWIRRVNQSTRGRRRRESVYCFRCNGFQKIPFESDWQSDQDHRNINTVLHTHPNMQHAFGL